MYLGIDIGASKTLVAALDDAGVIQESHKFPTPKTYEQFKIELAACVANISTKELLGCAVGVPGRLDRERGIGLAMGNLDWREIPIREDVAALVGCPVAIENDAKLAALSEAMLVKDKYQRVLYLTVSTGIGVGFVVDQVIEPSMAQMEAGKMPLEYGGKLVAWEDFASGRAIYARYGKKAQDITDSAIWDKIAYNLSVGIIDLIAIFQPEVIIFGGGVGTYYERFAEPLQKYLKSYETPMVPIPALRQAGRPEEAVIYGCYDLAKSLHGTTH